MTTQTLAQEKTISTSRFKLNWRLFRFRFAVGRGDSQSAQKFLNLIPLTGQPEDKDAFFAEERKLWEKYAGQDGYLLLITWKKIFYHLFKAIIGFAVVALLIGSAYFLTNKFIQLTASSADGFQPYSPTAKLLLSIDNKAIAVEVHNTPIVADKRIYLPVVIDTGNRSDLFYYPDKKFPGELVSLSDNIAARKFLITDGTSLYYFYNPGENGIQGTWADEQQFTALKEAALSGNLFVGPPGKTSELREQPRENARLAARMPGGRLFILKQIAPISLISSGFLWVETIYPDRPGKTYRGWLEALSLEQLFVEEDPRTNTIKIIAKNVSFRESPSMDAPRVRQQKDLLNGAILEFLAFAPLDNILTSTHVMIQVKYRQESGQVYTGWIGAAAIKNKFVEEMTASKKKAGSPRVEKPGKNLEVNSNG